MNTCTEFLIHHKKYHQTISNLPEVPSSYESPDYTGKSDQVPIRFFSGLDQGRSSKTATVDNSNIYKKRHIHGGI